MLSRLPEEKRWMRAQPRWLSPATSQPHLLLYEWSSSMMACTLLQSRSSAPPLSRTGR